MPAFLTLFFTQVASGVAMIALSLLIRPKIAGEDQTKQEMDDPDIRSGEPIPVPFGTVRITASAIVYAGEKTTREYSA
jgi:hypothetical protein